ncbi:MAG: flavodoxin domain-containing protein, partial [Planctomycetota bacterium]
ESTVRMAEAMAAGAARPSVEVLPLHVRRTDDTRTVTEVLDAACVAVGSSTLNMGMMPSLARTLTYLKGLKPQNKAGFAFGTHGWGRGGPEAVQEYLEAMKFDILREPYKVQWRPKETDLDECRRLGAMLADKAEAIAAAAS